MRNHLKACLWGLITGLVSVVGADLYGDCQLGCKESNYWATKSEINEPLSCLIFWPTFGWEGSVDGASGHKGPSGQQVSVWRCPYAQCTQYCPTAYNVPHESHPTNPVRGCDGPFTTTRYRCKE